MYRKHYWSLLTPAIQRDTLASLLPGLICEERSSNNMTSYYTRSAELVLLSIFKDQF